MIRMYPNQDPDGPALGARAFSKWGQERRLEFIDWRLRWDGRINRGDLTMFFGSSVPQASLDIAKYLEMAPANAVYDRRAKVYLAGPTFKPLFPTNTPERFLNELLALTTGVLQPEVSFLGWTPPAALVSNPGRAVSVDVLLPLLLAIRQHRQIGVAYQSMSSLEPTERTLSAHAIAFDGFRWHVRAYCHRREQFLDFVIARIVSVTPSDVPGMAPALDAAWHRMVTLRLGPNPELAPATRRVIELDYGMTDGSVSLECRQALLFYTLKRLGLLDGQEALPQVQQIALLNRADIEPYLPKSTLPR